MSGPLRVLTFALLGVCAAQGAAEERFEPFGIDKLTADGFYATKGFAARIGERQLIADAARYDARNGDLYLTGQVVLRQPGMRISATRLGLHRPAGNPDLSDFTGVHGDAWEVEARIESNQRTVRITAARITITEEEITFHDVDLDFGHGGISVFHAPKAIVTLRRPKPGEARGAAESHIKGIAMVSPSGSVVGLPLLWLPYLYKDFAHKYPWTRVRAGSSKRLGTWGRFWIGSDLPEIAGWRPGLDARIDAHSRAGSGFGLRPYWEHPTWGKGDAEWYVMPSEKVRGGVDEEEELQVRRAETFDAQHQINLGAGGAYARFTKIPGGDTPGTPPDYRFFQDYLPTRFESDPFPRQGATAAYGVPGATFTVDTERRVHPDIATTERWYGVQAQLHPVQLVGPLHLAADTWIEDLHQVKVGTSATRLNSRGYVLAGQWFPGGIGTDADAGLKEQRYANGMQASGDLPDAARRAPFADAGVKVRLEGDFTGLTHTIVPRVGVQLVGEGMGDTLPSYGFGDGREVFEEDVRYWVAGFDTAVVSNRTLFHATVVSRWAMREKERLYTSDDGSQQLSPQRLVDVTGTVDGRPIDPLLLTASFTYDGRPRRWTQFNTDATWRVAKAFALNERSTLIPGTGEWANTPGFIAFANRYRLDGSITMRPDGEPIDSWLLELTRKMVDGDLFFGFEFMRDEDGAVSDRRFSIGFTIGGATTDDQRPQAKTALTR